MDSSTLTAAQRKLLKYSRLEDAKECSFKPRLRARRDTEEKRDDDDDGQNAAAKMDTFAQRQEAKERARRKELDVAIKKRDYDARLDRKECPVNEILMSIIWLPLLL